MVVSATAPGRSCGRAVENRRRIQILDPANALHAVDVVCLPLRARLQKIMFVHPPDHKAQSVASQNQPDEGKRVH